MKLSTLQVGDDASSQIAFAQRDNVFSRLLETKNNVHKLENENRGQFKGRFRAHFFKPIFFLCWFKYFVEVCHRNAHGFAEHHFSEKSNSKKICVSGSQEVLSNDDI